MALKTCIFYVNIKMAKGMQPDNMSIQRALYAIGKTALTCFSDYFKQLLQFKEITYRLSMHLLKTKRIT